MSGSNNIQSALEETFEIMRAEGKNDVDNLVNWMKESKIIDGAKDAEQKLRKLFEGVDQKNVDLEKFKQVISKTAADQKKSFDDISKALSESGLMLAKSLQHIQAGISAFASSEKAMSGLNRIESALEETFEIMRAEGKNDVDSLVDWIKESKIIDGAAKDAEQKLRKLFEGVDQKNIDLEKFKQVISKTAADQKKSVDDISRALSETGVLLVESFQRIQAGISAFSDAINDLKKK